MADEPQEALGGRTPLEVSRTPNMDFYARNGTVGRVRTIPKGMPPGSDVAAMSLMGYSPQTYYTGRAPLEAASMGLELGPEDVAFRCNLVTLEDRHGVSCMADYSGGGVGTDKARTYVGALNEKLAGGDFHFYPGVSYRHVLLWREGRRTFEGLETTPPHDILGQPVESHLPNGPGSREIKGVMDEARSVLSARLFSRAGQVRTGQANAIWLWGQGHKPRMPLLYDRFGVRGVVVSAVDLIKGLGRCAGLDPVEVPGATGDLETNYQGKAYATLKALREYDFAFLHVEAPDEASHRGNLREKIDAIERLDEEVLGVLRKGLCKMNIDYRLMVLPDHLTPLRIRTHSDTPVPFLIYPEAPTLGCSGSGENPSRPSASFSEREAEQTGIHVEDGSTILEVLFRRD